MPTLALLAFLLSSPSFATPRAVDAFCAGGWHDQFQLKNYIDAMTAEKSLDADSAKMLWDSAHGGIQWPDASARILATYLGWTKNNQYPWAVRTICDERKDHAETPDPAFDDQSLNDQSVLALQEKGNAALKTAKTYVIRAGSAAVVLQHGAPVLRPDEYQPYCTIAHDTDPRRPTTLLPRVAQVKQILAVTVPATGTTAPSGFQVNFGIENDRNLTDVAVWLPGEIGTVARLRSVLDSCGIKANLKNLQ